MDVVNTLWTPSVSSGVNPTTIWGFKTITETDNTLPWKAPFILCVCGIKDTNTMLGSNLVCVTEGVKVENLWLSMNTFVSLTYNAPVVKFSNGSKVSVIYPLQL